MGIAYEDFVPRRNEIEEKTKQKQKIQQVEKQAKNQQLRELLVDPKWEMYAQDIDKRLSIATAAADNLAQKMLEGNLDTFTKLMPDYRYNLGIKTAFEWALSIVKETNKA